MALKSIFRIQLVLLSAFALSCGDDDDEGNSYSFKDQELSGEIAGDSWTYADGFVEESTFDDESVLDISLFLAQDVPACETFGIEGDEVFFVIPNAVGLYKLSVSLNLQGRTVTLLDKDDFTNYIAGEGAIEILAITETHVIGRIDARYDGNNHVNGDFMVSFCPETGPERIQSHYKK